MCVTRGMDNGVHSSVNQLDLTCMGIDSVSLSVFLHVSNSDMASATSQYLRILRQGEGSDFRWGCDGEGACMRVLWAHVCVCVCVCYKRGQLKHNANSRLVHGSHDIKMTVLIMSLTVHKY